jgi:hypothetical protein
VENLEELEDHKFSSYKDWIKKKGENWLLDCFDKHPIKDFMEKSEGAN